MYKKEIKMANNRFNQKIFKVLSYIIKKEIQPQNYVSFFREIDCTEIENARLHYQRSNLQKPSYTSIIIKAVSQAVKEHPHVNSRIFPGFPYARIFKFPEIHFAVGCEQNFPGAEFMAFIDIIKNSDNKSIDSINDELIKLSNANIDNNIQLKNFIQIIRYFPVFLARRICVLPSLFPSLWMKYRGSSMIISSPSKYGVDAVAGVWPHPLGFSFGLAQKKPIVKNNKVEIVKSFTLTMCFDRRILAGAPAARFFNSIANNLMNRDFLATHLEETITIKTLTESKITAIA